MKKIRSVYRIVVILCVCTLTIISAGPNSLAYVKTGQKLNSTISYQPASSFGALSVEHMGYAASAWSSQVSPGFTLINMSSSTHSQQATFPTKNGQNCIYRLDVGFGYQGTNQRYVDSTYTYIIESDININMYNAWANSAQPGAFDVYTIILHEFGHTVGLEHVENSSCVMYHEPAENYTNRTLTTDDKNGVKAIY